MLLLCSMPTLAEEVRAPSSRALAQNAESEGTALDRAVASGQQRVALVIGNADYQAVPKLQNPVNDAEDICSSLKSLKFQVTCATNVSGRRGLRDLVRNFVNGLTPGSVALFYFAGHGVQINGENYLLPTNIDAKSAPDVEDEGLSLTFLLRSLEESRSAPNIVILDACRDNPFVNAARLRSSVGLARVDPPVGTVLVYATAPNKVALDGTGRNGLFTKHLLTHLPQPGLTLDELFRSVAQSVETEAREVYKSKQVPYRTTSFSIPFCLAGCDTPDLARMEQIQRESEVASKRIQDLMEENARLKDQAARKASEVSSLEARISKLSEEAKGAGTRRTAVEAELEQLRLQLDRARVSEQEANKLQKDNALRDEEISELKARLRQLQEQEKQIAAYRKQIEQLKREKEELAAENNTSDSRTERRKKRPAVIPSF